MYSPTYSEAIGLKGKLDQLTVFSLSLNPSTTIYGEDEKGKEDPPRLTKKRENWK